MNRTLAEPAVEQQVRVTAGRVDLEGTLGMPAQARAIVLFAHGSGSGRHSPRNRFVANRLRDAGLGTLLIDLLTEREEVIDSRTGHLRFDIGLLAERLVGAIDWLRREPHTAGLPIGLFGASTGAAAAVVAAAKKPNEVYSVVSRGGRPDLAATALRTVRAPTLLLVGGEDEIVITLNEQAMRQLAAPDKQLVIVPGAGHLFEEPGKLDEVAHRAADWFCDKLGVRITENRANEPFPHP
jgi:dienelactone hydrolase